MAKLKGSLKIKLALGLVGKIQYNKVKKASKNCKKTTEKTLRGILEYAKDTEWGKSHNYAEILRHQWQYLNDRWLDNHIDQYIKILGLETK